MSEAGVASSKGRLTRSLSQIAVLVLLVIALPVAGQESRGAYVGLGISSMDYEGRHQEISYADTPLGLHAYGGYRLSDRLSVELVYRRFDTIESGEILGSGIERLDISAEQRTAAIRAMFAVPISELLPLRRELELFATAGLHQSKTESFATELGSLRSVRGTSTDSGLTFGGGLRYRLSRVDLRGYVEWIDSDGRRDIGVAVEFRF